MNISRPTSRKEYANNRGVQSITDEIKLSVEPLLGGNISPANITRVYDDILNAGSILACAKDKLITRAQIYATVIVYKICNGYLPESLNVLFAHIESYISFLDGFDLTYPDIEVYFNEITTKNLNQITSNNKTYNLDKIRKIWIVEVPSLCQNIEFSPVDIMKSNIAFLEQQVEIIKNLVINSSFTNTHQGLGQSLELNNNGEGLDSFDQYRQLANNIFSALQFTQRKLFNQSSSIIKNNYIIQIENLIRQLDIKNNNILHDVPNYFYVLLILCDKAVEENQVAILQIIKNMLLQCILKKIDLLSIRGDSGLINVIDRVLSFSKKYLDQSAYNKAWLKFAIATLNIDKYFFSDDAKFDEAQLIFLLDIVKERMNKSLLNGDKINKLLRYLSEVTHYVNITNRSDILQKRIQVVVQTIVANFINLLQKDQIIIEDVYNSLEYCNVVLLKNMTDGVAENYIKLQKQLFTIIQIKLERFLGKNIDSVKDFCHIVEVIRPFMDILNNIDVNIFEQLRNKVYNIFGNTDANDQVVLCSALVQLIRLVNINPQQSTLENIRVMIDCLFIRNKKMITIYLLTPDLIKFLSDDVLLAYYDILIKHSHQNIDDIDDIELDTVRIGAKERGLYLPVIFPPLYALDVERYEGSDAHQVHNELNKLIPELRSLIEAIAKHNKVRIRTADEFTAPIPAQILNQIIGRDSALFYDHFRQKESIYSYLICKINQLLTGYECNHAVTILDNLYDNQNLAMANQFFIDMPYILSFLLEENLPWVEEYRSVDSRIKELISGLVDSVNVYATLNNNLQEINSISCFGGIFERLYYRLTRLMGSIALFTSVYARCQVSDSIFHKLSIKLADDDFQDVISTMAVKFGSTVTLQNIIQVIIECIIHLETNDVEFDLNQYINTNHNANEITTELIESHINSLWQKVVPILEGIMEPILNEMINQSEEGDDPFNLIKIKNMAIIKFNKQ